MAFGLSLAWERHVLACFELTKDKFPFLIEAQFINDAHEKHSFKNAKHWKLPYTLSCDVWMELEYSKQGY